MRKTFKIDIYEQETGKFVDSFIEDSVQKIIDELPEGLYIIETFDDLGRPVNSYLNVYIEKKE
jgi:hypothetical protein